MLLPIFASIVASSSLVFFKNDGTTPIIEASMTNAQRRQAVYDHYHSQHQTVLAQFGSLQADDYDSLWMSNAIYVKNDNMLTMFQNHPAVDRIEANEVVAKVNAQQIVLGEPRDELLWSLQKVNVQEAWNYTRGVGTRIGVIDTGVQWDHPAIVDSYAGSNKSHDYSWFDPKEFANDPFWCNGFKDPVGNCIPSECCLESPFDIIGHGTHVVGTIAGHRTAVGPQIGVAPEAKVVVAKGCKDGQCMKYGLLKSAEWVICPTKIDGTEPRCDLGVDVCSNSWGAQNSKERIFERVVQVWREANIIPVFAIGNNGPSCGSVSSPGNFKDVIGVGATNEVDALTKFSSRGPGVEEPSELFGRQKPDFVAPGYKIFSAATRRPDNALYMEMSGTSMATPHVSAVVALMISAYRSKFNKDPTYSQIYEALQKTSECQLQDPIGWGGKTWPWKPVRKQCDAKSTDVWPNTFYGHGRVDAGKAVKFILQ